MKSARCSIIADRTCVLPQGWIVAAVSGRTLMADETLRAEYPGLTSRLSQAGVYHCGVRIIWLYRHEAQDSAAE